MSFDPFLTSNPSGSLRSDFDGCLGFHFTTPSSPVLTVSELGRWKVAGNGQSHTVYIKLADGTVIASAVVNFTGGAGTDAAYNYTAITPVALLASTKYFVLSTETSGGDQWYESTGYTTSGVATLGGSSYSTGCTGAPTEAVAGESYVPPNLKLGEAPPPASGPSFRINKLRPGFFKPGLAR